MEYGREDWFDGWRMPVEFRNAIDEKLQKKLLDTGRFVVLERAEMENLEKEKALKEEATGQSQRGKTVFAQAMVKGKVTDFALDKRGAGGGVNIGGIGRIGGSTTEAKCAINVRIFNVDTSELIASEEAAGRAGATGFSFSGNSRVAFADFGAFEKTPLGEAVTKAIDKAVEQISAKLAKMPWSCRVADFDEDSKEITLNAGTNLGVQAGDVFEVLAITKVIKDPETGEILGTKTAKVGKIRVKEVQEKISIAEIVEGTGFGNGNIVREIRPTT
jgi:curli biogenesis system outer membrane secretion channel CsgG